MADENKTPEAGDPVTADEAQVDWVQTTRSQKSDDVDDFGLKQSPIEMRQDVNSQLHTGDTPDTESFFQDTTQGGSGAGAAPTSPSPAGPEKTEGQDRAGISDQPSSETTLDTTAVDASQPVAPEYQTGGNRSASNPTTLELNQVEPSALSSGIETDKTQSSAEEPMVAPSVPLGTTAASSEKSEPAADADPAPEAMKELSLTPARPDMPLDIAQPGETVSLSVRLGGEAYRGDPAYEILVDGEVVASGKVDWAQDTTTMGRYATRDDVDWRDVTVDLQVPEGGFGNVEVRFPNDAYKKNVGDRNLLVDKITIDDVVYEAEADDTIYHGGKFADGGSREVMPWRGTLEFDVSDMADHATVLPAPEGAYIIENDAGASVGTLNLSEEELAGLDLSVSDDRFEIVGNTVKLKEGISLDFEEESSLAIEVVAENPSGASTRATFDVAVADVPEPIYTYIDGQTDGAFTARYFDVDHRINELADIDWTAEPTHQESIGAVDYKNSRDSFWEDGSKDTFGVQINGQIDVPESGTYSFTLGGDDGAMLFIDGQPVIDNDGLHSFKSETVEIDLAPGPHAIEVIYFENHGHAGLKLEWDGPGIDGPALVAPMDMQDAQSFEGVALSMDVDLPRSDELVAVQIEGLPAGFALSDGAQHVMTGQEPVDVNGWDLSNLQIVPPIGFSGDVNAVVEGAYGDLVRSQAPVAFEVVDSSTAMLPPLVETGFRVEFFEEDHSLRRLEDVDFDATPAETGVLNAVDFKNSRDSFWEGGATDHFAARVTGEIEIGQEGMYDFRLASDDGAMLYINGEEVIDNDGLHGFRNRDGEIELEPGLHEIEILYFENTGNAGLRFEYSGPDTGGDMSIVPATTTPSTDNTQPAEFALNVDSFTDVTNISVSGLPEGTWMSDGSEAMIVGDSAVDISSWSLERLEITPPEGTTNDISAEISVEGVAFNGAPVTQTVALPIEVRSPENNDQVVDQSLWDTNQDSNAAQDAQSANDDYSYIADLDQHNSDDDISSSLVFDG